MSHYVFGIRHHGPGSARSLVQALKKLQPDCILIEGPPEADDIVPLAFDKDMQPPVAILVYAPDNPKQAVYYPFAEFSPEWQALQYGLKNYLPVRFMDLPISIQMGIENEVLAASTAEETQAVEGEITNLSRNEAENLENNSGSTNDETDEFDQEALLDGTTEEYFDPRHDPLVLLAQAAGYADSERWWEHMVEERQTQGDIFAAILEAMTALRTELDQEHPRLEAEALREQRREAHMRKTIRAAEQQGFSKIAVICGAWHAPALQDLSTTKADNAVLKGLPKVKTVATWIPWTYERLSTQSGYGAGVESPGWYAHMWQHPAHLTTQWLTKVAHTFRHEGIDISSAHVIETVRLAETLAALRERPQPTLAEMNEAIQSVMLFGDAQPMQLLKQKLLIGTELGAVPESTPQTPLQIDLTQQQKRLKLKPSAADEALVLDLRKPIDLERSHLLRRLIILNIHWGQAGERVSGKGTFKESWRILWQPEFTIRLIEAGYWGTTVEQAATYSLLHQANNQPSLEQLATLTQQALLANLPEAIDQIMQRLEAEAAVSSDVLHLMQALPELAHLLRYGDVRKTSLDQVEQVVKGIVTRICIGLPNACSGLNNDAAENAFKLLQSTHESIQLLAQPELTRQWQNTLLSLLNLAGLPYLLMGRSCRLLLDSQVINAEESAKRLNLALSLANDPLDAAAWIEGLLRGSGQLLIHDQILWQLIDNWLNELKADTFQALLPVLRRTFTTFTTSERKQMGQRVKQPMKATQLVGNYSPVLLDEVRAQQALPLLGLLLDLKLD